MFNFIKIRINMSQKSCNEVHVNANRMRFRYKLSYELPANSIKMVIAVLTHLS